jgi:surfeit locus 1 family protein
MKIILGNWSFNPKLITSLLTLIFLYLFISLGFWQLDRADYKRNLYSDFEQRQSSEAINFNLEQNFNLNKEQLIWRRITATGEFLEQYQVLLDNQVVNTHAGYFVYTPFKLDQSDKVVLVNRGWVISEKDRAKSPVLELSSGLVEINAVIKDLPKTGMLLKDLPPEKLSDSVYRVQRINLNEIEELTQLKLLPYISRLEPDSEQGYSRQWRVPGSGEGTHKGYAFQWFAFAATLILIYLVLNIKKND